MAKMLVVDDSPADQTHLKNILMTAGHVVVTAESGRRGLELARSERPDVVFMDIVMANMDGFDATRGLQEDPDTRTIPVIIVSSKNQKADKMWAKMQGARGYLVKPVKTEGVLGELQRIQTATSP